MARGLAGGTSREPPWARGGARRSSAGSGAGDTWGSCPGVGRWSVGTWRARNTTRARVLGGGVGPAGISVLSGALLRPYPPRTPPPVPGSIQVWHPVGRHLPILCQSAPGRRQSSPPLQTADLPKAPVSPARGCSCLRSGTAWEAVRAKGRGGCSSSRACWLRAGCTASVSPPRSSSPHPGLVVARPGVSTEPVTSESPVNP